METSPADFSVSSVTFCSTVFSERRLNRWLQSFGFGAVIRLMEQLFARRKGPAQRFSPPRLQDVTLVVTHAELSYRHGTGALLIRILQQEKNAIVFHSRSFFEKHDIALPAFQITHERLSGMNGTHRIQKILSGSKVTQILCVPFYPDEALSALAAHDLTKAPLVLYIMDDQNIHAQGISDQLMERLVRRSAIRFVISEPLRAAYEQKFGCAFFLLPPVIDPALFASADREFSPNDPPLGVMIGNMWNADLVSRFVETIRDSGLQVDWYGNAGKPFIALDQQELARAGIHLKSLVPEEQLISELRKTDYAVVPSGMLDEADTHNWLAKTSLPSRIVYLMTTANLPILVLGHPDTAAARFVTELKIGTVCSYDASEFVRSVQHITDPAVSARIRKRASELSPKFSSRDLFPWIRASAAQGQPVDHRFANLTPRRQGREDGF
jgi:hypothetical protein